MNGIETAKLFKENGGPAVVFVSAYDAPSIVAKAMEMQPLAYLVKPVDMEELKTFLRGLTLGHVEVAVSRL